MIYIAQATPEGVVSVRVLHWQPLDEPGAPEGIWWNGVLALNRQRWADFRDAREAGKLKAWFAKAQRFQELPQQYAQRFLESPKLKGGQP